MMIDVNTALDALDECIDWKLKPALDSQKIFDDIASNLRRLPAFQHTKIVELDLALADLKRSFANEMREAEWQLYDAFRCSIGAEN
jgi:hypothetical protein